jgi:ABC-type antimicrobial peptide transport system permease subunit
MVFAADNTIELSGLMLLDCILVNVRMGSILQQLVMCMLTLAVCPSVELLVRTHRRAFAVFERKPSTYV